MSYELLFLDMDGTLKQEPDQISETNKEAIRLACQIGKKVMIASGRNRDLILTTIRELHLDKYGESFTIALNGAHIIDNTGRTLHTEPISLTLTRYLFEKAFEYEISCHVYTENYVYFNYRDFQFEWYQKNGCECRLVTMEHPELDLKEIPLKFYLFSKDEDKLKLYKQETEKVTNGILNAEFSSRYSLEFTSIHASKGLGLEYVCGLFGLPLASAIAAGDGENDISMLKMAGLGIAMKNALDSVKAIADTITKRTCKEDGVTEIIEDYLIG